MLSMMKLGRKLSTPLSSLSWNSLLDCSLSDIRGPCPGLLVNVNNTSSIRGVLIQAAVRWSPNGFHDAFFSSFSTMTESVLVQVQDSSQISSQLESAIEEQRFNEAWNLYTQYMEMEGFPRKSILNKLLVGFGETCTHHWLEKANNVVELVFEKGKQDLIDKQALLFLSLMFARHGLPIPASSCLRRLIDTDEFVPVAVWSSIVAHISCTAHGAYVGAELVIEIGSLFENNRVHPWKESSRPLLAMKPTTTVFNIAIAGCLLSGATRKAEQVYEMMCRLGVKHDAILLILMAHIYERNGRREELKKLKRHIDDSCSLRVLQFQHFYNCLLTCHLNFGDLDSASQIVLELLRKAKEARESRVAATTILDSAGSCKLSSYSENFDEISKHGKADRIISKASVGTRALRFEDFCRASDFLMLEAEADQILDSKLRKLQMRVELVTTERGVLRPTERIYAKLVKAFLEAGKVKELTEFLISVDKEDSPASSENSVVVHVINACITLGWLDRAHDLIEETWFAGVRIGASVYSSLLDAYYKENRIGEMTSLLRDARKAGVELNSTCYEALIQSWVLESDSVSALNNTFKEMKESKISEPILAEFEIPVSSCPENKHAGLTVKLMEEIKEGRSAEYDVHDWNSVIHFFCKKGLMQDADKALKKMKALGHMPNAQTFQSLVMGYYAIDGKYVEVAQLWGEMKELASSSRSMKFDHKLLDSLLCTFVRGGLFLRANEVVDMMEAEDMFIDKYKCRNLFLIFQRTLHKNKKTPNYYSEASVKRREAALLFKKWISKP